jgi:hypothetical protein
MRVTGAFHGARARLADESGFSMLFALGVLMITAILIAAIWTAVGEDAPLSEQNVAAKQAYAAASAGAQAFLYHLNENSTYWETCSNDTSTTPNYVAGSTTEYYEYAPVLANSASACSSSNPTGTLIDTGTGTLRLEFTGYSDGGAVSRGIVAGFKPANPFDYVWFTVYEALDSSISGDTGCNVYYRSSTARQSGNLTGCNINWITGDSVNGPMFTDDQYLVESGNSPTFGRSGYQDEIASAAPCTSGQTTQQCDDEICAGDNCQNATLNGVATPGASAELPPANTTFLATDAAAHGITYSGTTTITLNGATASVSNCPTTTCTTSTVTLANDPIIYVANASGCTPAQYSWYVTSYSTSGCTGDVYVQGNYTAPLTIGAADDIIVNGNVTTTNSGGTPTGSATLGLIANEFIRVEHGCTWSSQDPPYGSNISGQYTQNLTIDAEIMAVQHSFIVDNFPCGSQMGALTINGAIAQYFRGAVGEQETYNGTTYETGYLKNYTYDNRLEYLLPPYLFDITSGAWQLGRQTLCVPNGTTSGTQC